jgi:hypothetical protein
MVPTVLTRLKPVEIGRQQSELQSAVFHRTEDLHPQAAKQEQWEERNKLGLQFFASHIYNLYMN